MTVERWSAAENEDAVYGNVLHVVPIDDLIEHDTSGEGGAECVCGPEIEQVIATDIATGAEALAWLVQHSSLDGREHSEPDHDSGSCPLCQRDRV